MGLLGYGDFPFARTVQVPGVGQGRGAYRFFATSQSGCRIFPSLSLYKRKRNRFILWSVAALGKTLIEEPLEPLPSALCLLFSLLLGVVFLCSWWVFT